MTTTFKFTVAPAAEYKGKWVARMFYAPKIEGHSFGTFGIKTMFLGLFSSKEQAQAAVDAKSGRVNALDAGFEIGVLGRTEPSSAISRAD